MSGRRSLFSGLAAAVMLPAIAPLATAVVVEPDAVLIRLCAEFIAATEAYDRHGGIIEDETQDPLWVAFDEARERLEDMRATTLAGVMAKAEVALHQARQPSGVENFDTGITGDWPEQVVRDLLGMRGAS